MKRLFLIGLLAASAGLVASAANIAQIVTSNSTYYFTGTCAQTDPCNAGSGLGTGVLVLSNYTLGSPLSNSNLVSFTYTSSVFPKGLAFVSGSANITGTLTLGAASVSIFNASYTFSSSTNGTWSVTLGSPADIGTGGTWSAAATPEPATLSAVGIGIGGLLLLRRRLGRS